MNNDYTHITIVLDSSGSMVKIWDDTIGGFNTFLAGQKELPGKLSLSQIHFSSGNPDYTSKKNYKENSVPYYYTVNNFEDVKNVNPLTRITFVPGGGTPLLDTIGIAIEETGQSLKALKESDRPAKVLFVIITDGEENASRIFNRGQIKTMIDEQTTKYGWLFSFLGSNFDAIKEGATFGISASNSMSFASTGAGVGNTYNIFNKKVGMMRSADTAFAASAAMDYMDNERVEAMAQDEKPEDLNDRLTKFKQAKASTL